MQKVTSRICLIACLVLALFGCGQGGGSSGSGGSVGTGPGSAALSWQAPTTNEDGTPLADLAGFKVYYGTVSPIDKSNGQSIDVGNTTAYTLSGLSLGTHYFTVTAYDISGNESPLAQEVSKEITGA